MVPELICTPSSSCTIALPAGKYCAGIVGTRIRTSLPLSINDFQRRTQILLPPVVRSAESGEPPAKTDRSQFVGLTRNGSTVDRRQRMKTTHFGDVTGMVRVPVCHLLPPPATSPSPFAALRSAIRQFYSSLWYDRPVDQLQFGVTGSDNQFTAEFTTDFTLLSF